MHVPPSPDDQYQRQHIFQQAVMDKEYDYGAAVDEEEKKGGSVQDGAGSSVGGEEALMDLAQLEELHQEAEKMKALGNKHMAAQEYTRAYNAYSAALQLSPVGPASHVFLSNRAAALLSLKRYHAAATDARRAVALAPTFGKAHARLGQALYFLKDYAGAVTAYEDAIQYEPDNQVTKTYLEKAKKKQEKRKDGEQSIGETTAMTRLSLATDTHKVAAVASGVKTQSADVLAKAAAKSALSPPAQQQATANSTAGTDNGEDPDFDEALKIQQRANKFLANKQYKAAIEEYTAALFLVPDDIYLSPDLHLGRAHALNGSRRHERARNDAQLAIKLNPSPAAFSTLAKSLFYMKDYRGAIDAFNKCTDLLPEGEALGMFDKAYLAKAEAALAEEEASLKKAGQIHGGAPPHVSSNDSVVPKLRPPRFVPREQAIQSTPNLPPMPQNWPQQSPSAPPILRCGPERDVVFLSESLGIKLNRGADGIVRVLSVAPNPAGSPVARSGQILRGDVVREAAGVDIRRPITNIMWGDTIALIKMAPRPIRLVVATELSPVPQTFLDEQRRANDHMMQQASYQQAPGPGLQRPSNASTDVPVRVQAPASTEDGEDDEAQQDDEEKEIEKELVTSLLNASGGPKAAADVEPNGPTVADSVENDEKQLEQEVLSTIIAAAKKSADSSDVAEVNGVPDADVSEFVVVPKPNVTDTIPMRSDARPDASPETPPVFDKDSTEQVIAAAHPPTEETIGVQNVSSPEETWREREEKMIGGEILFERTPRATYCGWDNLSWMAYSGARKIRFCQGCYRAVETEERGLFWSKTAFSYGERLLAIYDEPCLILVLRKPEGASEVNHLLGFGDGDLESESKSQSFWIVESVVEPAMSKIKLSQLTTVTSVTHGASVSARRSSCFAVISPHEEILLSAVRVRANAVDSECSYSDSGAFLETTATEAAVVSAIVSTHEKTADIGSPGKDISWKHQLVLGTLCSHVVVGNTEVIELAVQAAGSSNHDKVPGRPLPVIDSEDDNGLTPLFYACARRMHSAVNSLVRAGANVSFRESVHGMTLAHICAKNLDARSLALILSSADANSLDFGCRTPMYVATIEGRTVTGTTADNASALNQCLQVLERSYGRMTIADSLQPLSHPVCALAGEWRSEELSVVLAHSSFRFPLHKLDSADRLSVAVSAGALFEYPVHMALCSLRQIESLRPEDDLAPESGLVRTLRVLLEHGFEVNERVECSDGDMARYFGFTPLQILALAFMETEEKRYTMSDSAYAHMRRLVFDAAEFLVRNGARLSMESPLSKRPRRLAATFEAPPDQWSGGSPKWGNNLKKLLDVDDRLGSAESEWSQLAPVDATGSAHIKDVDASEFTETCVPGGNSSVSCAICWRSFGTITNRKQRCRITVRFLCDDCSGKRIKRDGKEYRISDGQFLLARVDAAKKVAEAAAERERLRAQKVQTDMEKARKLREEEEMRSSLFGGMIGHASNLVFGGSDEKTKAQSPRVANATNAGMVSSLNETRNALHQRGEKLASLGEKSSKMVDASSDFARMATQLRKQSEGGLFW